MKLVDALPFLASEGETGTLIREHDWATSPLGPPEQWPQPLCTMLGTCLECPLPILVWWGPELVTFYNDACSRLLGARHPGALGRPARDAWPEIADMIGPMLDHLLHGSRAPPSRELVLASTRDGREDEVWISLSCSPVRDESGDIAGVFCPVIETTARVATQSESAGAASEVERATGRFAARQMLAAEDRLQTEEALRARESVFRTVADHAPAIIWLGDAKGATAWLSRGWYELTGQSAGNPPHDAWAAATHPEDADRVRAMFRDATAGQEPLRVEYRLRRPDGSHLWVLDTARPRFGEDGDYQGHIGAIVDIDDRRRVEHHRTLLIDELNHRVKNTLSIVQGIAHQSLARDEATSPALAAFEGRLNALADAHGLLTSLNWEPAALEELVRAAIRPVCGAGEARVAISGPPVRLRPKQAVSVAIALHELATNALKHGALSDGDGRIDIGWESHGAEGADRVASWRLSFEWVETGGPPVSPPERRGFGSRLIERALGLELGGAASLDFRPEGVVCRIEAPLTEGIEVA